MLIFNASKLFFVILIILILTSCSFKISPPSIPTTSQTLENPIINKKYQKQPVDLEEKLFNQSQIKKIKNKDDLKDFFQNKILPISSSSQKLIPQLTDFSKINFNTIKEDYFVTLADNNEKKISENNFILKNDLQYIYLLKDKSIFILEAYPSENAKILSEIKLKNHPIDFFISHDRLCVLGNNTSLNQSFNRKSGYSYMKIYDISSKEKPKELRNLIIEGSYFDFRLIDDYVYIVNSVNSFKFIKGESLLPKIFDNNVEIDCYENKKCLNSGVYYFDIPYFDANFIALSAIDIQDVSKKVQRQYFILPHSYDIYVSSSNIYFTYSKYLSQNQLELEIVNDLLFDKLNKSNRDKIKSIYRVGDFILNEDEKQKKISSIFDDYISYLPEDEKKDFQNKFKEKIIEKNKKISKELEKTIIHKLSLNNGNFKYQSFGEVEGVLFNKFSMKEKDDIFFITTFKNKDESKKNKIYNLYSFDGQFKPIGELKKFAAGKQFNFIRFMQDRAYFATSNKADYLLVVDLSKANQLKVLGDLKIPDFSNYSFPYNKNILINISQNLKKDEQGNNIASGVKLSLFDVSDIKNPKEIDAHVWGGTGSNSSIFSNRNALFFSYSNHLLLLPILIKNSNEKIFGNHDFNGVIVLNVDKQGFSLNGLIDHNDILNLETKENKNFSINPEIIKKSVLINDVLYTFSDKGIKLNSLKGLNILKSFSF